MPICTITAIRMLAAAAAFASLPAWAASNAVLGYDDARHLLARTGFGPTDAEVRAFAPLTRGEAVGEAAARDAHGCRHAPACAALDTSSLRPPRGEMVTEAERKAFVQQQVREGLELRAWWVQEMLGHAVAADRANDAVLAQPLRVGAAQGADRTPHVPAERDAAPVRARQLRRVPARDRQGPGDDRLPRQRAEPEGRAEREFRARGDGALHAGRGPLLRAGREGGGARIHRLEPRARDRHVRLPPPAPRRRDEDRASGRPDASTAMRCSTFCSRGPRPPNS